MAKLIVRSAYVHKAPSLGVFEGYVLIDEVGNYPVVREGENLVALVPDRAYSEAVAAFERAYADDDAGEKIASLIAEELTLGLAKLGL